MSDQPSYLSFEKVYKLFYKPGLAFLTSLIKDKPEAENLVQEVFVKIWMKRDTLVLNEELQPYIFTSLRNIAFDYFKSLEKSDKLKMAFLEEMKSVNEELDEHKDSSLNSLLLAIENLSEKRKIILKLNYEEGKSYQEIAHLMRISKNTVKNQLIKAKQSLKASLDCKPIADLI